MAPKHPMFDHEITTVIRQGVEYICITDIARFKNPDRTGVIIVNECVTVTPLSSLVSGRNSTTLFSKPIEFDGFRKQASLNSFTLPPNAVC